MISATLAGGFVLVPDGVHNGMIEGNRMRVSVRLGSGNVGKLCPATNLSVASIGVYSGDGPLVNAVRTISGKGGARTHHHHRSLHIGGKLMCKMVERNEVKPDAKQNSR